MASNVHKVEGNLYTVKSRKDNGVSYVVDTFLGRCECSQGINGSTCWHQFLLWSNGINSSPNFMPVNDPNEKKRITEIAIGVSLAPHYYDNIHNVQNIPSQEFEGSCFAEKGIGAIDRSDCADETLTKCNNDDHKTNVLEKFSSFYENVVEEISQGDSEFQKSVLKFISRYEKFSPNQRKSAF